MKALHGTHLMPKMTSNPLVVAYFCNSPCRVCSADRTWFNLIVKQYIVIARRCLRCEHKERALLPFFSSSIAREAADLAWAAIRKAKGGL